MTRLITALTDISDKYDALFVDLWGCVHDGVRALPDAVAALQSYRAQGGTVVLVTNSPRARGGVEKQLDGFGVPRDAWDTIATSGDSARAAMFQGVVGEKVWFIGQPFDDRFFDPLHLIENPVPITRVPLEEAEGIVCIGPFDPHSDPADLRPQFLYAKQKGLKLLCANPDIVVDRGEVREWCAGALARLYTEMGGTSLYFGKPHPPIYVAGAMGEDIDSLFISGGLAANETKTSHQPDEAALTAYLSKENASPTYTIGFLR